MGVDQPGGQCCIRIQTQGTEGVDLKWMDQQGNKASVAHKDTLIKGEEK